MEMGSSCSLCGAALGVLAFSMAARVFLNCSFGRWNQSVLQMRVDRSEVLRRLVTAMHSSPQRG